MWRAGLDKISPNRLFVYMELSNYFVAGKKSGGRKRNHNSIEFDKYNA